MDLLQIEEQINIALTELLVKFPLDAQQILVMGVSTSEIIGKHIGTAGSMNVAKALYEGLHNAKGNREFYFAFQGCEHINRALICERETAQKFGLEIVSVVPAQSAGGAMATYAYYQMKDPVVVEFIKADAGIDIGDTLIGMHLKHVAVPLRSTVKTVGGANLTMATTRPKLIGGARAQYNTSQLQITEDNMQINNDGETC